MYRFSMIYAVAISLALLSGCNGAPNPTASMGTEDPAIAEISDQDIEDVISVTIASTDGEGGADTPDESRSAASLRERIREARDSTAQILRRAYGVVQDSRDRSVHRLFNEARARWNRAQEALKRYPRSEGKRRDSLLNAFFENTDTARDLAIQAARLARGNDD